MQDVSLEIGEGRQGGIGHCTFLLLCVTSHRRTLGDKVSLFHRANPDLLVPTALGLVPGTEKVHGLHEFRPGQALLGRYGRRLSSNELCWI